MEFSITAENCRICLENKSDSKLISEPYPVEILPKSNQLKLQSYFEVYKFVAEICGDSGAKLTTAPSTSLFFPQRICNVCVAQLNVSYIFRRKILESEKVLKNLLQLYGRKDNLQTDHNMIEKEHKTQEVEHQEELYEYLKQERVQDSSESENEAVAESLAIHSHVEMEHAIKSNRSPKNYVSEEFDNSNSNDGDSHVHSRSHSPLLSDKPATGQCEDCGKMISARYLATHRENHRLNGNREKPFACDICDRKYTLKENLNKHKRSHSNDKRYTCPFCNEKFLHWASRKYHIACRHTGEKPFICEVCGKGFRHSSQYYTHVRRHTGFSPYACEICDRRFITLQCKKTHMLTHTDAKDFHCNVCGKSYKSQKSLRVHIRTLHDQEKNYICPVCTRAFSQNHVLRTHLLKNHPEYEPPPPGTIVSIRAIERIKEQNRINDNISQNVA